MAQSAVDLSADASDFEKGENIIVTSRENDGARRYLRLPFSCQLVSYGNNVVASVSPEFREIAENYINKYPVEHLFETPHLHTLNEKLMEKFSLTLIAACKQRSSLSQEIFCAFGTAHK